MNELTFVEPDDGVIGVLDPPEFVGQVEEEEEEGLQLDADSDEQVEVEPEPGAAEPALEDAARVLPRA